MNGIFKGLNFSVSLCKNGINFIIGKIIGIINNPQKNEYKYYNLEEIPFCDDEIVKKIKISKYPFIIFNLNKDEVLSNLNLKGYNISSNKYIEIEKMSDFIKKKYINTKIHYKIKNLNFRLGLKIVFNYMCYIYDKDFIMQSDYDYIRNYVRYDKIDKLIIMQVSNGGIKGIKKLGKNSHIIGTAWKLIGKKIYLIGFFSFYNLLTYSFILKEWSSNFELIKTQALKFNNKTKKITKIGKTLLFEDERNDYTFDFCNGCLKIIKK